MRKGKVIYGFVIDNKVKNYLYTLWFNCKVVEKVKLELLRVERNLKGDIHSEATKQLLKKKQIELKSEIKGIRDNIKFAFEKLDKSLVPYDVQNIFSARGYKGESFDDYYNSLEDIEIISDETILAKKLDNARNLYYEMELDKEIAIKTPIVLFKEYLKAEKICVSRFRKYLNEYSANMAI